MLFISILGVPSAKELFVFYFKLNDGSSSYAFLLKR